MSETGGQLNIAILPLMNEVGNYSLPRLQWPLEPLEPLKDTFEYVLSPQTIKFGALSSKFNLYELIHIRLFCF